MRATDQFTEIVVFGGHGHATSSVDSVADAWEGTLSVVAVVDDFDHGFTHPHLGCPVVSGDERLERFPTTPVMLAVGATDLREQVAMRLIEQGATFATVHARRGHHPPAHRSVVYGPGSVVAPHTMLGSDVSIGIGAFVAATAIAHDTIVGDFATVGVGSNVLGHVRIGRGANVAPGAVIGNGTPDRPLRIGDGAVIGVGAVVVRDVGPGARMVGNPAMTVADWRRLKSLLATEEPARPPG